MRFMYANEVDISSYTLTANSENANYPVENVQEQQLSKKYWATGDTSEWVKLDGGSSEAITANMAAIIGHNISSGATTIKIQGHDTDVWTDPTVDQSFTYSAGLMWKVFTSDDLRYWRWLIEDASNPDTVIKIGRLFLGTYFDLSNWAQASFTRRTVDTSVLERSATGQGYGDERITYKEYEFEFPIITNTERVNLETMWETNKKVKPIVLIPNPDDTTLGPLYAYITDWDLSHIIAWQWRLRLVLSEAL